jgi:hypothetical protein
LFLAGTPLEQRISGESCLFLAGTPLVQRISGEKNEGIKSEENKFECARYVL